MNMDTRHPLTRPIWRIRPLAPVLLLALTLSSLQAPHALAQRMAPPSPGSPDAPASTRLRDGDRPGPGRGMQDLGIPSLSEEQRDGIRKIRLEAAEASLPIQNQLREKRARLQTLSSGAEPDARAARAVIEEIGELQSQLMRIRWEAGQSVRGLLTDEQRVVFDQRRARMAAQGGAIRGAQRGGRSGQGPGRGGMIGSPPHRIDGPGASARGAGPGQGSGHRPGQGRRGGGGGGWNR